MTLVDEIFDIGLVDTERRLVEVCPAATAEWRQCGRSARQAVAPESRG